MCHPSNKRPPESSCRRPKRNLLVLAHRKRKVCFYRNMIHVSFNSTSLCSLILCNNLDRLIVALPSNTRHIWKHLRWHLFPKTGGRHSFRIIQGHHRAGGSGGGCPGYGGCRGQEGTGKGKERPVDMHGLHWW